jgi:choline monooxygenase
LTVSPHTGTMRLIAERAHELTGRVTMATSTAAKLPKGRTKSGIHPDPLHSYNLPSHYYYAPDIYEREKEAIWFGTWQLVGFTHDLKEPGSYFTDRILDQQILVVRGKDTRVRAFYNVCMHRGHILAEGKGQKLIYTCPFHAWSYDTTGALKAAGNAENVQGFDLGDFSLAEIKCEVFLNMVFVNLDPKAEPLGPQVETLRQDILANVPKFDRLSLGRTDPYTIKANWKFVIEQNECYHCPSLHPQAMGTEKAYMEPSFETTEHGYWGKHIVRTKRDVRSDQMPYEFRAEDDIKDVHIWYMWPNLVFLSHHGPSNFKVTRVVPTGPEATFQTIDNFCINSPPTEHDVVTMNNYRDVVLPQDIPAMEMQQAGMKSRGFKQGRLMCDSDVTWRSEHGTHKIDHMVWVALNGENY